MGDGKCWNTTGTPINRALFPQKISERAASCTLLEGVAAVPGRSAASPSRQRRASVLEGVQGRERFGHVPVGIRLAIGVHDLRSEEHTSELQSLMRISYAVFCLTQNDTYVR